MCQGLAWKWHYYNFVTTQHAKKARDAMDLEVSYQQMFNKAKSLVKAEVCMKFYDDTKLLYLETDVSGVGLEVALLQLRDNTACQKGLAPDNTNL